MLGACRKTLLFFLSGMIVASTVAAPVPKPPKGVWVMENTNKTTPFAKLELTPQNHFDLVVYDNTCQAYPIEGEIKPKSNQGWELKNASDYSNTFMLTRENKKLELFDVEHPKDKMLFVEISPDKLQVLEEQAKKHCTSS